VYAVLARVLAILKGKFPFEVALSSTEMSKDHALIEGGPESSSLTPNDGNSEELGLQKDATSFPSSPPVTDRSSSDKDEYPHGLMLSFIIIALLLSIFLVSIAIAPDSPVPPNRHRLHLIWSGSQYKVKE
jgi:hypothetical protein